MKKKLAAVVAALAIPVGAVGASVGLAPTANAVDYGVNMNQACQLNWGAGWQSALIGGTAGDWRCYVAPYYAVKKGVNVQLYCNAVTGGTAIALNWNDPYSWRCRV